MAVQDLREQVKKKVDDLTDDEVIALMQYMDELHAELVDDAAIDDPTVGMFTGPTDLSRRAKEILRNDITARSGWTQKKDE
jgi:hypothetical protein